MAPTPTITPWPGMRRGTEWTVPSVPGLVMVIVVPARSSAVSLPVRGPVLTGLVGGVELREVSVSACLMFGTTSVRVPSGRSRSTARPRLTPWRTGGLAVDDGVAGACRDRPRACTMAQATRWVKLTLPRRSRLRWLLRMSRLTSSSLAGTSRTDVAVGTVRLASMFSAICAAAPRSGTARRARAAGAGGAAGRRAGAGAVRRGSRSGRRGGAAAGAASGHARGLSPRRSPATLGERRGVLEVGGKVLDETGVGAESSRRRC